MATLKHLRLPFLVALIAPELAEACSRCALAATDRAFPPIERWLLFPFLWYLAAALLAREGRWRDGGFGPWWWRFAPLPVVFFVLFGVLPSLAVASLLTLQPALQAAQTLRPSTRAALPRWLWTARLGVFVAAISGVAALQHQRADLLADRDPVDWALEWTNRHNGYPVRALAETGELSIDDVRRLVDASAVPTLCRPLAPRLGRDGSAEKDVSRLLGMADDSGALGPEVAAALSRLTGVAAEGKATVAEWKAALDRVPATPR